MANSKETSHEICIQVIPTLCRFVTLLGHSDNTKFAWDEDGDVIIKFDDVDAIATICQDVIHVIFNAGTKQTIYFDDVPLGTDDILPEDLYSKLKGEI